VSHKRCPQIPVYGPMLVRHLRKVHRKWGWVLSVTDNASQHKHGEVKKYLKEHDGVEMLYLPTATKAQRSRVRLEGCKIQACYLRTLRDAWDMTHAGSKYFRTYPIRLDIYKFLYRYV